MFPMEETQTCLWPKLEVLKNDLLIVLNTWYKKTKQNRITVAKVYRHIKTLNG